MERLFVYGTLKDEDVQKDIIGRITESHSDTLEGFALSTIKLDNIYKIIISAENNIVRGLVLSIYHDELRLIDEYETNAYKRKKVVLKSGTTAWTYTK